MKNVWIEKNGRCFICGKEIMKKITTDELLHDDLPTVCFKCGWRFPMIGRFIRWISYHF